MGKDGPQADEIVHGVLRPRRGLQAGDELAEELQDHVKRSTAPYKYPREIHFVSELPEDGERQDPSHGAARSGCVKASHRA